MTVDDPRRVAEREAPTAKEDIDMANFLLTFHGGSMPDGSVMDATSAPSGYSIIKANDLDSAVALAKGCPVLAGGAAVVVSETFPVM